VAAKASKEHSPRKERCTVSRIHRAVLLTSLLFAGCGSDDPVTYEQVLVNEGFTVAAGASNSVLFSVDMTEVANLRVNGYIQADGNIQVLLLTEAEFDNWSADQAFASLYDSGETELAEFVVSVNETGRYNVLISNAHDDVNDKAVQAFVSVVFDEP
jgi:hypothetical protein